MPSRSRRPPRQPGDRAQLLLRDGDRCWLCDEPGTPEDPLTVDHVVALARGGSDDLDNKRLAHRSHNQMKGTA